MISRVADHCFWFGRYVERAESTARLLAATRDARARRRAAAAQSGGRWSSSRARRPRSRERFGDDAASGDGELVQRFMAWDARQRRRRSRARSRGARWNARSIREVLSLEAWEAINELHLWFASDAAHGAVRARTATRSTSTCAASTQLTLGLLRSTMLHDEPLDFIWLGVLLERVSQTARMLDVHHHAFTSAAAPATRSSRPRCGCRCCARCRAPRRT